MKIGLHICLYFSGRFEEGFYLGTLGYWEFLWTCYRTAGNCMLRQDLPSRGA
jgi:hypothetical protein